MARTRRNDTAWTPNQIVAYRVARARFLRGWTQDQAAAELEPYLGTRLSTASFSAIERSFAGGRTRQFSADEILALARGFRLPIGWFFTPPPVEDRITVATPDADGNGHDPMLLIDAILTTDDTLEEWERDLRLWSVSPHRVRIHPGGRMENLGREVPDVHQRTSELVRLRTAVRLGELFGDTDQARHVLQGLIEVLDDLDQEPPDSAG